MKFDCGNSYAAATRASQMWHKWFAWYPVYTAPHKCVWLEYVERKRRLNPYYSPSIGCFNSPWRNFYRPWTGRLVWK